MPRRPAAKLKPDWSREYIKYRIRAQYGSMVAMAGCYGLDPSVIKRALGVPYPKVERTIVYSTQTGHPFHAKLDSDSTANWTVGA